uniref:Retrotransposon gag domain-containing protein n=1 Tax=Chromera velia CCMP2878 TaxID=1169474 RepID=A0A0G4GRH1_9ALVE|eukprot:Cvel_23062.t1-p1 / transcript=Cvel_23062.t1 / gene=Cvel_23062 / organism=Chromera_velia_CCMP2878 / gene_product=hypothetical protein / transcript_product=hypothetical protein / location=Cvel_scaffold2334:19917-20843(-) / protein_length=309 / sequence_SO=supercontig / SO=protein_coding / is_pseudo=false
MTKFKALDVRRVMESFKKGEDDPVVWMSIFMKKVRNGNLNMEECKVLFERHAEGVEVREWMAKNAYQYTTIKEFEQAFLDRFMPTEAESQQAVYELSQLKLSPTGDFDTHVKVFEAKMRVAQPGHEINARIFPFLGTFYPLLSIEITTEPAHKEYAKLIPRVLFFYQQEQKKGPNLSAKMAPAAKSADDVKQLCAQISSLQSSIDLLQRQAQYLQEASAALQQSMAASFEREYNGGARGGNWRERGGKGQAYPTSSSSSQSVPGGNTLGHPNYVGCRQCGSKENRIAQCSDTPRGSGGRNQGNGRGGRA